MNTEESYYFKLKTCLLRSPSDLFNKMEFVSFGGFGNEIIVRDLIQIHGGLYSQKVKESSTHFLLPLYTSVDMNAVRDVIRKKDLILVPLFWVFDSIIQQRVLPIKGEQSEYDYVHDETMKSMKRRRDHIAFGPPIKKKLTETGEMLFIFPTGDPKKVTAENNNLPSEIDEDEDEEEEDSEPTLLTPQQKITFQLQSPPEVDPRLSKGKHVYFDGRNRKYFSVMLYFPEKFEKSSLAISQRKYFNMQLVRGFSRGDITLFCRWGRAGGICYSHQILFRRINEADLEFQKKYKELTNNEWNCPIDQIKHKKGYYIPINFEYKFNLPKSTGVWTEK